MVNYSYQGVVSLITYSSPRAAPCTFVTPKPKTAGALFSTVNGASRYYTTASSKSSPSVFKGMNTLFHRTAGRVGTKMTSKDDFTMYVVDQRA